MNLSSDMWIPPSPRKSSGVPKIVALGGDGIGPEVVEATLRCIEACKVSLEISRPIHGTAAVEDSGNPLPDETKRIIDGSDAVLLVPSIPVSATPRPHFSTCALPRQ